MYFAPDSCELSDAIQTVLAAIAKEKTARPTLAVELGRYTDSHGDPAELRTVALAQLVPESRGAAPFTSWEYLAEWYVKETGLDNSVALVPREGQQSDYAIVNWARWDVGPLPHFWHQLSRKTFWSYVTANLEANRAASMPVYCRLA